MSSKIMTELGGIASEIASIRQLAEQAETASERSLIEQAAQNLAMSLDYVSSLPTVMDGEMPWWVKWSEAGPGRAS